MDMFWIGLVVGSLIGGIIAIAALALLAGNKEDE